MTFLPLYIGTIAMLLCSCLLIFSVARITSIRKAMEDRDKSYLQRLNSIEMIVTKDLKDIIAILRKN